jgi:predicted nucleic acid binding AN1-type Zn finger protein
MPFECNYCKDKFCPEHRLPENHRCVKLHLIRAKRFGERKVIRGKGIGRQDNIFKKLGRKLKK